MEVKVRPRPSEYARIDLLRRIIFIDNGLLERASDEVLNCTIQHEYGHMEHLSRNFLVTIVFWVFFVTMGLLLSSMPILMVVLLLMLYMVFCLFQQSQELQADRYALRVCGPEATLGFLSYVYRSEKRVPVWLSVFVWHPSAAIRIFSLFKIREEKL